MNQLIIGIGGAGTHVINKLIKTREPQNNQRVEYIAIDYDYDELIKTKMDAIQLEVPMVCEDGFNPYMPHLL